MLYQAGYKIGVKKKVLSLVLYNNISLHKNLLFRRFKAADFSM